MVSSKNFKYKKWAEKINPPQHLTKNLLKKLLEFPKAFPILIMPYPPGVKMIRRFYTTEQNAHSCFW